MIFGEKPKKKKERKEVIPRERQPVLIELLPKGTKNNPILCKANDKIFFRVKGYTDYKKENEVELVNDNIMWHKYYIGGDMWEKDFGVENTYYAPDVKGYRDIYIKYKDSKLVTSCKVKILVEV